LDSTAVFAESERDGNGRYAVLWRALVGRAVDTVRRQESWQEHKDVDLFGWVRADFVE